MQDISQETKEVLRYWLRGYRKGFAVNLAEYIEEEPIEIRKKILMELCMLCDEDFKQVTVWGY